MVSGRSPSEWDGVMRRLILDTHAFLWWRQDSRRLKRTVRRAIGAADVVIFSAVCAWEIAIKIGLGKLRVDLPLEDLFNAQGFSKLPLRDAHALALASLPFHHRDPFDRMLIAQAQAEDLTVVTHDLRFEPYPVQILWT